jgi:hypothetical protein
LVIEAHLERQLLEQHRLEQHLKESAMNDQFLHDLRRAPDPAFARRLRLSLDEADERKVTAPQRLRRFLPIAASLAAVSVALAFPGVRAGAQAFLDLFRIDSVVGVSVDARQLRELTSSGLDIEALLGGAIEPLTPPADPVTVASTTAGFDVIEPAWRPVGLELAGGEVLGAQAARMTLDMASLELVLDLLGIDDLTVPQGFDGEDVTVRMPSIVTLDYAGGDGQRVEFVQALSPEIALPDGFDLPAIAEIALRIAGADREQAYELAWTIDWRSTLIMPVPAGDAAFERIDIGGHEGVAVTPNNAAGAMLFWADGDHVYALAGTPGLQALVDMAQSAR